MTESAGGGFFRLPDFDFSQIEDLKSLSGYKLKLDRTTGQYTRTVRVSEDTLLGTVKKIFTEKAEKKLNVFSKKATKTDLKLMVSAAFEKEKFNVVGLILPKLLPGKSARPEDRNLYVGFLLKLHKQEGPFKQLFAKYDNQEHPAGDSLKNNLKIYDFLRKYHALKGDGSKIPPDRLEALLKELPNVI